MKARNGRGAVRVLTRQSLDGRTRARKQFDAIALGITQDLTQSLGDDGRLSTIQHHLIEAFAGVAVHVGALNARLLLGETIDIGEHSQAVSSLVRLATRLGVQPVTSSSAGSIWGPALAEERRQQQNGQAND